jgi:hypothetical protein
MDGLDAQQVFLERGLKRFRQHGHAIFRALAVSDDDLVPHEVNVLNAKASS